MNIQILLLRALSRKHSLLSFFLIVGIALLVSITSQAQAAGTNILPNTGCENGTTGYSGYQATLATTTTVKHSGTYACKLTATSGTFYTLQVATTFTNPTKGQSYTASAWVRSDSNAGKTVYVAMRESGGSTATKTTYGPGTTLTTTWQQVTNTYTIQATGRTKLEFYVVQDPSAKNNIFYADDLLFQLNTTATTTPTTVPLPTATPVPTIVPTATPTPSTVTPTPTGTITDTPTPTPSTIPSPTPTPVMAIPYGNIPGTWTMKFNDEFDGTTLSSNWNNLPARAPNNPQEYDCYAPGAVSVGGGFLNITISNQPCTVNGTTYRYTGGQIDTDGHINMTYGYYEARVYSPGSAGRISNWPAWWMVGTGNCWPVDGEIDIFEGFKGDAGYHYGYGSVCDSATWQGSQTSGKDMTGWHVYAVNWQPGSLKYYYDGVLVGTITQGVSNKPMMMLLDNTTAPQGNVGGPVVVPATMQVDYVRVWQ